MSTKKQRLAKKRQRRSEEDLYKAMRRGYRFVLLPPRPQDVAFACDEEGNSPALEWWKQISSQ